MDKSQREQLESVLKEEVSKYASAVGINIELAVQDDGIAVRITDDNTLNKNQERTLSKIISSTMRTFSLTHGIHLACGCDACSKVAYLKGILHVAIKSGMGSTTPEIDDRGNIDTTKQIDEAVNRVIQVLINQDLI